MFDYMFIKCIRLYRDYKVVILRVIFIYFNFLFKIGFIILLSF